MAPTAARVRELFNYDPETGSLTWRVARNGTKGIGSEAGTDSSHGYRHVTIDGRIYKVHRVAWLYTFGEWPTLHLDHINCNRSDNRISNLRPATCAENAQNIRGAPQGSRTGVLGVVATGSRWMAHIQADGCRRYLGTFATIEEASTAYLEAKRVLHPFSRL